MITPLLLAMTLAPQQQAGDSPAARAVNELGLAIYRSLESTKGKNLFVSPLSVTVALTMLTEGAREETAAELRQALHLPPNAPLADLHAAMQALVARYREGGGNADPAVRERIAALRTQLATANAEADKLARGQDWKQATAAAQKANDLARQVNRLLPEVDRYELRVANALWVERTYPLVPAFAQTVDRFYGTGGVNSLDFRGSAEAARLRINGWVEEHTERHIKDLIPSGGIDSATSLVISNAVFFRGEWDDPFRASDTREEDFLLANGGRVRTKMMRDSHRDTARYAAFTGDGRAFATPREVSTGPSKRSDLATYPRDDGFTMLELPYKGREIAMLVIAPRSPDGLPRIESLLTATSLASWVAKLEGRAVDVALPRFEQRCTFELSRALQAAGVRRAFVSPMTPGGAQFGGIADDRDPARALFVSNVHHQAWLQVDEKGTEAAAATAVMVTCGAALPMTTPFVPAFRADRPFLFLIRDVKSGAILFLGRVVDPNA